MPTPTIKWVKVNESGEVIKEPKISALTKEVYLSFKPLKLEDRAKYRCIAENVGGVDQQEFNLEVGCKNFSVFLSLLSSCQRV